MTLAKRSRLGAAVAAVVTALMLLQGCTSNPFAPAPAPAPALTLNAIQSSLSVAAGDNLTFLLLLKNNQKTSEKISFTVPALPSGWRASLSNDTADVPSKATKALFVVVVVAGDAAAGSYKVKARASAITKGDVTATKELSVKVLGGKGNIVNGANVQINYIGYLENYQVFDTSLKSVGMDNNIPKSPQFKTAPEYNPLSFTVGAGQMIKGFDAAMVGLRNGQSRTIRVEPKDGYGRFETAKINISEEFPMYRTIPKNDFMLTYSEEAVVNKVVVEPYWYWKVQVVAINGDNVTVVSLPEVNQTSKPYGWDTKVLDVNGTLNGGMGRIVVRHYPTTGINVTFGTFKAEITSLTATQVELTYNVNSENALATQALIFQFTVTSA